jgi:hypothetical protein
LHDTKGGCGNNIFTTDNAHHIFKLKVEFLKTKMFSTEAMYRNIALKNDFEKTKK